MSSMQMFRHSERQIQKYIYSSANLEYDSESIDCKELKMVTANMIQFL